MIKSIRNKLLRLQTASRAERSGGATPSRLKAQAQGFLAVHCWWLLLLLLLGVAQLGAWYMQPTALATEVTSQMHWQVVDQPQQLAGNPAAPLRFLARIETAQDLAVIPGLLVRAYCYSPCADKKPVRGARYASVVSLMPPDYPANPTSFDYGQWLTDKGISAIAQVRTAPQPIAAPGWLDRLHNQVLNSLAQATAEFANQELLLALLTGQRGRLGEEQRQLLIETATMHLFVVSGMHLGLSFVLCLLLLRLTGAALGVQLGCGALAMLAYVWLAGFGTPAVRALVMALVAAWFLFGSRQRNLWFAWLLALVFVAGWQYAFWRDAGVLLSFCAVAILLCLAQGWRSRHWFWILLETQWVLCIVLGLVQAVLFQRISPAGFAANLVLVPLVSFVLLPLVLTGALLHLLPSFLSWPFFALADLLSTSAWWWLSWLQNMPWASIELAGELLTDWWVVGGCVVLALTLLMPPAFAFRRLIPLLALAPLIWWQADERPHPPQLLATRHDIYVLLQQGENLLVIAAAEDNSLSGSDLRFVLVPALRYAKARQIDWLALNPGARGVELHNELRQDQHFERLEYCHQSSAWPQVLVTRPQAALQYQCVVDLAGWRITPAPDLEAGNDNLITGSEALALALHGDKPDQNGVKECLLIGRQIANLSSCEWPAAAKFIPTAPEIDMRNYR